MRAPDGKMHLSYDTGAFLMSLVLRTLARWRVWGLERVPRRGPLILVANHVSFVDPPILAASLPRRITFMGKEELFRSPPSRLFFTAMEVFPVRRGRPHREALRRAQAVLEAGGVLGMFPEGRRSPTARIQPGETGTALLALHTGAPILPVGLWGTHQIRDVASLFNRPTVNVSVGEPFSLEREGGRKPSLERLTQEIMESIARLLPPISSLPGYPQGEAERQPLAATTRREGHHGH
ncbi:MAG: 1-acyl-sn-glycerol-3-phosphate acyltransferase [Chloroflexi bacterium]|nr:1-acyl-sn-glycerol-3-phosphate acyltransferase [Chloroflexota bacterium]